MYLRSESSENLSFFNSKQWHVKGQFPGIKIVLLLFVVTFLIRFTSSGLLKNPRCLDECYYYSVAVNLVENRSFTTDIKWTFIDNKDFSDPMASNKFWMPGISILMALSILIFGKSYMGARVLIILISSLFPIAVYLFSTLFFRDRTRRLTAWLLTLFTPWYFLYWNTMDNFSLFGLTAFLSLTLFYMASDFLQTSIKFALIAGGLAGLFAGAAHLCRADGGLIIFCGFVYYFLIFILGKIKNFKLNQQDNSEANFNSENKTGSFFLLCAVTALFYFFVMGPWFYRNFQVFGRIMPRAAGKTVFLREYNQMFYYMSQPSSEKSLENGIMDFLLTKGDDFRKIGAFMSAGPFFFLLIPFFISGLLYYMIRIGCSLFKFLRNPIKDTLFLKKNPAVPQLIYFLFSFSILSTIFSKAAVHGTIWHTSAAWIPLITIISIQGFSVFFLFINKRKKQTLKCRRVIFFNSAIVIIGAVIFCFIYGNTLYQVWGNEYRVYKLSSHWIEQRADIHHGPPIISAAPGLTSYILGCRTMQIPLDGAKAVIKAAQDHNVRFITGNLEYMKGLSKKYGAIVKAQQDFQYGTCRIRTIELK